MSDWHKSIVVDRRRAWWEVMGYGGGQWTESDTLEGTLFLRRRANRKLRRRYIIVRSTSRGRLEITNAEVRFRKSKNAWGIFIDDEPVRHYRTLKAVRMSLNNCILDRMGAEGDRCLDPPYSAPSSKSEA